MKVQAIIPAAGAGKRLKNDTLKPFVALDGAPLIIHTLRSFEACDLIGGVILVVPEDKMGDFESLIQKYKITKVDRIVTGGASRHESVHNGLEVIDRDTEVVVVHDGARPLVDAALITKAVEECEKNDAVIIGVPIKPTVKRIDPESMSVKETLKRDDLWEIQTPQAFKKEVLIRAHEQAGAREVTDDAMLLEKIGVTVRIVEGDYRNIKVTTPEDLLLAEALIAKKEKVS